MKRTLLLFTTLFFSTSIASAQSSSPQPSASQSQNATAPAAKPDLASRVPTAKPDDVKSIDAILHAIYDVISGPPGERDWNRFRSLFVPEARLTSTVKREGAPSVRLLTVDDYVKGAGGYFLKNGFFESAIVNHVDKFGNITQVFSSYESRHAAAEKPFTRGINSIQLLNDGNRWYVLSILWDEESANNPLPKDLTAPAATNNNQFADVNINTASASAAPCLSEN